MMKKTWLLAIPATIIIGVFAGPKPEKPTYNPNLPEIIHPIVELDSIIREQERVHKLKPDNEARIIWASDSAKTVTDYSIVYLHGFSASQFEGAPTHLNIAKKFNCNLYLARLAEHGIDTVDALANLTADKYWESAKQALAIGKKLGRKVILMGTSTGGTNALHLAATFPNDIAALILLSPNCAINDPNAWILNDPWGLQIAEIVSGGNLRKSDDTRPLNINYWNTSYRIEALVALEQYLETTMTKENFRKITQPTLVLYYYKDEKNQDPVVKVEAMKNMFNSLGTPENQKIHKAMPNTGNHVIGSPFKSNDAIGVEKEISGFLSTIIK
jgi:pimeloyl-ACP methyl ester carboxylesterase